MNHPFVRLLFEQMSERHISVAKLAKRSGLHESTIRDWRSGLKYNPSLVNIEAALNSIGYQISVEKRG